MKILLTQPLLTTTKIYYTEEFEWVSARVLLAFEDFDREALTNVHLRGPRGWLVIGAEEER